MPEFIAGSSVPVWCDVRDVLTAERAAAAGVTLRWVAPDGVPIVGPAEADGDGVWRGLLAVEMAGAWTVEAVINGGGVIARAGFVVVPAAVPADAQPAPMLTTPDGVVLVLRNGAAMRG